MVRSAIIANISSSYEKALMVHSIERIRRAVASAADGADIVRAYLFGSYARGEAGVGSDVDLCLETGPTFSLFSAGAFVHDVERDLGVPVDVTTERSLFPAIHASMLKDRVLLYERT